MSSSVLLGSPVSNVSVIPVFYHSIHETDLKVASPFGALFACKKVYEKADSNGVFRLIKSWLDKCLVSQCGWEQQGCGRVPTRILDVGPADGSMDPILIITNPAEDVSEIIPEARYIALS